MNRLTMLMFTIIAPTLAGMGVIISLVMGHYNVTTILISAACGFVVALPVTYFVSRKISDL
ncbi:hypothetical protein ACFE33_04040 [Falsihalocynthiibacter sp. SS001]|uniref:hypothetical protein n=1 Tax=Falsihalocynthiibacter sp. SS001 TaxID=3349698 RepID=UPI0036D267AD